MIWTCWRGGFFVGSVKSRLKLRECLVGLVKLHFYLRLIFVLLVKALEVLFQLMLNYKENCEGELGLVNEIEILIEGEDGWIFKDGSFVGAETK